MIRIAIVDDHQIFIDGIKALLASDSRFRIVGDAVNGTQALDLLSKISVDVLLLDVNMPQLNGIDTLSVVIKKFSETKVIMLTMYNQREFIIPLIHAGASGYLLKSCNKDQLCEAIETVYSGRDYFSKDITDAVIEGLKMKKHGAAEQLPKLSMREIEVPKLIAMEFTTKEIGHKLFISENTVETHRRNLISKLNVRNIAGLVRVAYEMKLL